MSACYGERPIIKRPTVPSFPRQTDCLPRVSAPFLQTSRRNADRGAVSWDGRWCLPRAGAGHPHPPRTCDNGWIGDAWLGSEEGTVKKHWKRDACRLPGHGMPPAVLGGSRRSWWGWPARTGWRWQAPGWKPIGRDRQREHLKWIKDLHVGKLPKQ